MFDNLCGILHDADIDKRIQFMIEDLFANRKARFRGHPPVRSELDLIEAGDQMTHQVELFASGGELNREVHLDVFEPSPFFARDEAVKRAIVRAEDESQGHDQNQRQCNDGGDSSDHKSDTKLTTDADLINLRWTVY